MEEKFIKFCETSDFVLVDGHLGIYDKKYETIMFPRNGMCPPNIKIGDYDYYEENGEKWILSRNDKVRRYHIRFLNEVKDEEPNHEKEIRKIYKDFVNGNYECWNENNKNRKHITDERPTIPTIVGPIKNYSHRPLG